MKRSYIVEMRYIPKKCRKWRLLKTRMKFTDKYYEKINILPEEEIIKKLLLPTPRLIDYFIIREDD